MNLSLRVVFVAVVLLILPIASQEQQCDLPSVEDAENVGADYLISESSEGASDITLTVHDLSFTCLARAAFDKYSYASVVVNGTASHQPGLAIVRQFQMMCVSPNTWREHPGSVFDSGIPSMPFDIDTDFHCSECLETLPNTPMYNTTTNCLACLPDCLGIGAGFCTGPIAALCCPFFNGVTGNCVDNCTSIGSNFVSNEDFVCVCRQISCDPGYTINMVNCICELTDGCQAAGQPCQNGGICTSDLSSSPYYACQCPAEYVGQNCDQPAIACDPGCMDGQCDLTTGCCERCQEGYVLENNCSCVAGPTTEPIDCVSECMDGHCDTTTGCCTTCQPGYVLDNNNCSCVATPTTEPTCPPTCRDCEDDNRTCCSACPEGMVVRSCLCVKEDDVEENARVLTVNQSVGIGIALMFFIFLLISLAVLFSCVVYYAWATKKQRAPASLLANTFENPYFLSAEEDEGKE